MIILACKKDARALGIERDDEKCDLEAFKRHLAECKTCREAIEEDARWGLTCPACGAEIHVVDPRIEEAIEHLDVAIEKMEQSKSAFQSATIAQARAEAEKAKEILEEIT